MAETIAERYRRLRPGSWALWERAGKVIPGGITHDSRHLTPFPLYVTRGAGPAPRARPTVGASRDILRGLSWSCSSPAAAGSHDTGTRRQSKKVDDGRVGVGGEAVHRRLAPPRHPVAGAG